MDITEPPRSSHIRVCLKFVRQIVWDTTVSSIIAVRSTIGFLFTHVTIINYVLADSRGVAI